MNTDIRIKTSFLNHRKVKRLESILGECAVKHLVSLWLNTAMSRPDGVLTGMDVDDIAFDANWVGSPNTFIDAMLKAGFLDPPKVQGAIEWYSIHDWEEHQPWASNAEIRSLSAAKNQAFRWCSVEIKNPKNKAEFKVWYYEIYKFVKGSNRNTILPEYDAYTKRNTPILSSPILSSPKDNSEPFQALKFLIDLGVEEQIAKDFLVNRKTKKQANTITAFNTIKSQINKTKKTPNEIIKKCVEKGWASFRISWMDNDKSSLTGSVGVSCQGCMSEIGCPTTKEGKPPEGKKCFYPTNAS